MEFKGSASLRDGNINVLKHVHGDLDLRVERVDQDIGRVYVVDQGGNAQPLPTTAQGELVITMTNRTGANVQPHNNEFLYIFVHSYTVSVNGNVIMRLDQQNQHSVMASRVIVHETIVV